MSAFHLRSAVEQVAAHLRSELAARKWTGTMPGVYKLVEELRVSRETIEAALRVLEAEGMLVGQGAGKRRKIVLPTGSPPPTIRVQVLLYEDGDRRLDYLLEIQHLLTTAGYISAFANKTLFDLGMDVKKVSRFVAKTEADAWIVVAGSREVLDWFAEQPLPAFAIFGRIAGIRMACAAPRKGPALVQALDRLVGLGHRRIVMLAREERRKPAPGFLERLFLDELEARGIPTGSYNLPDWENSAEGFHRCLGSLFGATPPTALILSGSALYFAAMQHLSLRGIQVPRDVSLVCFDPDPAFAYCQPPVSHIRWDSKPLVRVVMRWAKAIRQGNDERRTNALNAEFIEAGTVGPVLAAH